MLDSAGLNVAAFYKNGLIDMKNTWLEVTPEDARRHPLFGVGGWLIFFAITLVLGFLRSYGSISIEAHNAGYTISEMFDLDHPSVTFIKASLAVEAAVIAVISWLLFSKSKAFRPVTTAILCFEYPAVVLIAVLVQANGVGAELAKTGVGWLLHTVVWVSYLQRSKRVRVTFENTVKANDSALQRLADAGAPFQLVDDSISLESIAQESIPPATKTIFGKPADTVVLDKDEKIFAVIAEELETGAIDKALWTRLFAECGGDERKQKVRYIQIRAERLRHVDAAPVFVKAASPVTTESTTVTQSAQISSLSDDTTPFRDWTKALLQECYDALMNAGYEIDTDFSGRFIVITPEKQKIKLHNRRALNEYLTHTLC